MRRLLAVLVVIAVAAGLAITACRSPRPASAEAATTVVAMPGAQANGESPSQSPAPTALPAPASMAPTSTQVEVPSAIGAAIVAEAAQSSAANAPVANMRAAIVEAPHQVDPPERDVIAPQEVARGDGRQRVRLVRRPGSKYPLVRIEESVDAAGAVSARREMVGDHVLVTVAPGMAPDEVARLAAQHGASIRRRLGQSQSYLLQFAVDSHDDFPTALAAFAAATGRVVAAEPDAIVRALGVPSDDAFAQLWGMHNTGQTGGIVDADIDAPEAWSIHTGSKAVLVGVIDTGIDRSHPDLAANMWTNPGESGGGKESNGVDDDGNGFVDDWRGWDFVNGDNDPHDDNNHGTHCAGTIGAVGDNGIGVAGVCWNVSLVGLKFLSASGSGSISDAVEATLYAATIGCDLTSNSWGGGGYTQALHDAIEAAPNALFVAAAGNSAGDNDISPQYPASYPGATVISVAATDANDARAYFSCWGATSVDLAAPGQDVYSTVPGGSYASYSGTSMATPHVAGAVALLKAANPLLTAAELKQAIMAHVDPNADMQGKCVSNGRLNVHQALLVVSGPVVSVEQILATDSTGNGNGHLEPGEQAELTVTVRASGSEPVVAAAATLTVSSPYVTIIDGSIAYGDLAKGATSSGDGPLRVAIAADAPTPLNVSGVLTITAAVGGPWSAPVTIAIRQVGALRGSVRDSVGSPIASATVAYSGPVSGTVTVAGDGAYTVPVTTGSYTVTASAPGYLPATQAVLVTAAGADLPFVLMRPDIDVSPAQLTFTLPEGGSGTKTLTIANTGDHPLTGSILAGSTWTTNGLWHETSHRAYEGGTSWYYGIESQRNYNTGDRNFGALATDVVVPTSNPILTAMHWRQVEWGSVYDVSRIEVSTNGGVNWTIVTQITDNEATWTQVSADLTPWAGQPVRLRFWFDTVDSIYNSTEGWYVDDVRLGGTPLTGWLTASASVLEVAPGAAQTVQVTASALFLEGGTYISALHIASNDPDEPLIQVPVTLTVLGTPDLLIASHAIDDDVTAPSNGDGDSRAEPGETIALAITVRNGGSAPASGVGAVFTTTSPYATLGTPGLDLGTIEAKAEVVTAPVVIAIASDCPDETPITISCLLTDAVGNSWNRTVTITVAWRWRISGVVRDAAGSPIAGAVITASAGQSTTSGGDGTYQFLGLPGGTYTLVANAADYLGETTTLALSADAVWNPVLLQRLLSVTPTPLALSVDPQGTTTGEMILVATGQHPVTWSILESSAPKMTGLWHESSYRAVEGGTSWYYGQEHSRNYDTGQRNAGDLTFVDINVPSGPAELRFSQWRQAEGGSSWDRSIISASIDGSNWTPLLQSMDVSGQWISSTADLSGFSGQRISLRFSFDTVDSIANHFEGWYVDDVTVNGQPLGGGVPSWMTLSATQGSVQPGAPIPVTVTCNAAGLARGVHQAVLVLHSDATNAGTLLLPVQLTVRGYPPTAHPVDVVTAEDTAVVIWFAGSDPDGDPLSYAVVTPPLHGSFDGFVYTPHPDYVGSDSFTYTAHDGEYASPPATVSITMTAVNDPPVAEAITITTTANTATTRAIAASDIDGDALTLAVVAQPAHGSIAVSGMQLTYTPAVNWIGADSCTIAVNDGTIAVSVVLPISVTGAGLPKPWVARDIGAVGQAGAASYEWSAQTFTIAGGGPGIGESEDAFRFVSRPVSGDVSIIARIGTFAADAGSAKAGLMIRESIGATSRHALLARTPNPGTLFQRRLTTGNVVETATVSCPWLMLSRQGNQLFAYTGEDGVTWQWVGTTTIRLGATAEIGMAVTSGDAARVASAVFSHVQVIEPGAPAPLPIEFGVNFQPNDVGGVDGYLTDDGAAFAKRVGGHTYGWYSPASAMDRQAAHAPDQRHDTLVSAATGNTWQMDLPNGRYEVHLMCGDPTTGDCVFRMAVNGTEIVSGKQSAPVLWIGGTVMIDVTDGAIRLSNLPGATACKPCFLQIRSVAPTPTRIPGWPGRIPAGAG